MLPRILVGDNERVLSSASAASPASSPLASTGCSRSAEVSSSSPRGWGRSRRIFGELGYDKKKRATNAHSVTAHPWPSGGNQELNQRYLVDGRSEVALRESGLGFESLRPAGARFFGLAVRFQNAAQVEQRFRHVGLLRQRVAVQADRLVHLSGLFVHQARVVQNFRRAVAEIDQAHVEFQRRIVIVRLD